MRGSSTVGTGAGSINSAQDAVQQNNGGHCSGTLYVVGIGPGSIEDMSGRAQRALEQSDYIVGYDTYLKLIQPLLAGKEIVGTGMMQEIERCRRAVELAGEGKTVAVVSSGDPGIYGMAGLVLELAQQAPEGKQPDVKVIPGISAVSAAAAVLGAPLMHDFAVISLSDLLTPWEVIVKRLEAAAASDFVVALYNPKSMRRTEQIKEARRIMLANRPETTPVGIVTNATREGETAVISNLADFLQEDIAMFSLVIIGNSRTFVQDGKMITPRGYQV